MTSALYTALAILGLIAAGLILFAIAWAVLSFERIVDYAAELFENEDGNLADAWGDVPAIHPEMRPARRFQAMGGTIAAELSERADTHNTHSVLLSGPLSGTEA
jgi:hypothetical protein